MGDGQHTQNIQINKVIGENENRVFYLMEKNIRTFWLTPYITYCPGCLQGLHANEAHRESQWHFSYIGVPAKSAVLMTRSLWSCS